MGFADTFRDFYESLTFSNELHAEAPEKESQDDQGGEEGEDKGEEDKEKDEGEGEGGDGDEGESKDEGGEEEEEEEEEEDEPVDLKPQLEADCAKSAQCAPLKHHFEECAERVHQQEENPDHKGPKEDCVEEFFHLQHCATQCAAPKLFRTLK